MADKRSEKPVLSKKKQEEKNKKEKKLFLALRLNLLRRKTK